MAEAMQGIMALQGASDMGAQGAPQLNVTPEQMAAFESARGQINPVDFGTELLKAGEQIDPMELKSLRDMLKQANLSPQIIDAIGQLVDTVLAEPEKYQEIRAKFLAEGVPEELLPEQFDAGFFAALNLALDQVNSSFPQENPMQGGIASMPMGAAMPMVEPQAFAAGGLASLKPLAAEMAKMGRRGDTMLAHITPAEARMLRRRGGSGTINPSTGLPEFNVFKKVAKVVGNAFKSVGKAVVNGVKSVARGVKKFASSTVGRIVIGVALAYFLGPMAANFLAGATGIAAIGSTVGVASVGGFIGGFGSTLLAGKGIKEALKVGAIGGVAAGVGAGVMGGAEAFQAGSYTGPTTISGQFDRLVSGTQNLVGMGTPAPTGAEAFPVAPPTGGTITSPDFTPTFSDPLSSGVTPPDLGQQAFSPQPFMPQQPNVASVGNFPGSYTPTEPTFGSSAVDLGASAPTPIPTAAPAAAPDFTATGTSGIETGGALGADPTGGFAAPPPPPGGTEKGFFGNLFDKISPPTPSQAQLSEIGRKAFTAEIQAGMPESYARTIAETAIKNATPSVIRQYGPLALGGLGIMSLAGGFKSKPAEPPNLAGGKTGQDLIDEDPEKYRLRFGGVNRIKASPTNYYNPTNYQSQSGDPYGVRPVEPVRQFAKGGATSVDGYPRKQGAINGPGTGTSDSIKALLSDGEFVFTAKAVRGAGQGSRRKGAKRMYQLMRSLEGKA